MCLVVIYVLDILYKRTEETPHEVFYRKGLPFSVFKHEESDADQFIPIRALACFDPNHNFCVIRYTSGSSLIVCCDPPTVLIENLAGLCLLRLHLLCNLKIL